MGEVNIFKKVFTGYIALFVVAVLLFFVMGCTGQVNPLIKEKLGDPENMYKIYDVHPTNLATASKCKYPPTVSIINDETRNEDIEVRSGAVATLIINPKETIDIISAYLRYGYGQSNIKNDVHSTKVLHLTMKDMSITFGVWTNGLHFKMGINIPEINFQKDYEATENSTSLLTSMPGAIHLATRKIIDDPAVQNYILCKDEFTDKPLSQILQELQYALDNGLISKEEYQLKRKELLEKY